MPLESPSSSPTPQAVVLETIKPTQTPIKYFKAKVIEISQENKFESDGVKFFTQEVKAKSVGTSDVYVLNLGSEYQPLSERQKVSVNQNIVVGEQVTSGGTLEHVLVDIDRTPTLTFLFVLFSFLVILVARLRGATSILAMFASLAILMGVIIPQILAGQNPIVVSLLGCFLIAAVTQYISHGWSLRSHLTFGSTMITLAFVAILSHLAVTWGRLAGLGSEEALFLQFGEGSKINLQGLLLAGIMLGTLGVLDDIISAQMSVVEQLKEAKPNISLSELISRSLEVGKDHVASLVNTLALAYAGSSLPLFLLFTLNKASQPWWVILNSEMVAEEIIRTLIGSTGLVLAVPLSSCLAAFVLAKSSQKK